MALTRIKVFVLISLQWLVWTEAIGNDTIDALIDQSISNLQQIKLKYKPLASSLALMNKLYGRCGPCKPIPKSEYCDCTIVEPKKDCLEFRQAGYRMNGIYLLKGFGFNRPHVFCDQTTLGGGWTTFLRRRDGSTDFKQNWKTYKNGFGELTNEFWLGNEIVHSMTESSAAPKKSELIINMRIKGKPTNAKYDTFELGDEASKYTLKISGVSGNATHLTGSNTFLGHHNKANFSTYDQDNDKDSIGSCSKGWGRAGWWFNACYYTLFTGDYNKMYWHWNNVVANFVEMKFRRKI